MGKTVSIDPKGHTQEKKHKYKCTNTINTTMTKNTFKNADEAYKYFFREILRSGVAFDDTQALFNVGFYNRKSTAKPYSQQRFYCT